MMTPAKVTVRSITEAPSVDTQGRSVPQVRVTFMVGDHGPFNQSFPREGFDPVAVNAALADFAQKIGQVG